MAETKAYLDHREKNGYETHFLDVYQPGSDVPIVEKVNIHVFEEILFRPVSLTVLSSHRLLCTLDRLTTRNLLALHPWRTLPNKFIVPMVCYLSKPVQRESQKQRRHTITSFSVKMLTLQFYFFFVTVGPSGANKDYLLNLAHALRIVAPAGNDQHLFELEAKVKDLMRKDAGSQDAFDRMLTTIIVQSKPAASSA